MVKRIVSVYTCAALLAAGSALGAMPSFHYDRYAENTPKFLANEWQVDLFGTGTVGDDTLDNVSGERIERDTRLGAGVGTSYFFLRNVGLGAEAYTENAGHAFVDNVLGSLIVRFPIEAISLAPYVLGGAGYQFDPVEQWMGHVGGGLEFRFNRTFGIFTDARYVFADKSEDFGLGRLGLRFGF